MNAYFCSQTLWTLFLQRGVIEILQANGLILEGTGAWSIFKHLSPANEKDIQIRKMLLDFLVHAGCLDSNAIKL